MNNDTVEWLDGTKECGFITNDETGGGMFAHFFGIVADGCKILGDGQKVTYDVVEGNRGLQIVNVCLAQSWNHRSCSM